MCVCVCLQEGCGARRRERSRCVSNAASSSTDRFPFRPAANHCPAPLPPPTHTHHTGPTPWPTDSTTPFEWRAHWYPVNLVDNLKTDAPNAVTLLGADLVAWYDAPASTWRAAHAACPHRLASLADGRVIDGGASLECRYHGWRFAHDEAAGCAKCVLCPQATDEAAAASVKASRRSRLRSLPATEANGVLWIWPQEGPGAAATAAKTPLPLWDDPEAATAPFSTMRPPVDWLLMTENSTDCSHAPYLHEKVMGPNTRAGAAPMAMAASPDGVSPRGFTLSHTGYTKAARAAGMVATRTFVAPGALRTHYAYPDGRPSQIAVVYFTPTRPGECQVFGAFYFKKAQGGAPAPASPLKPTLAQRAMRWALSSATGHVLGHALGDQDVLAMSGVARAYANAARAAAASGRGGPGSRAYWLATPSDVGVGAFHKWVNECAGGGVDWDPSVSDADRALLTRAAPGRADVLDHYTRHTAHCAVCQRALARLDKLRLALAALALAGTSASVGLAAAKAGAGAGARAVVVAGVPPAALAVVAAGLWVVTGGLRERFFRADKLADE